MPSTPLSSYARPERERARARLAALTKTRTADDPDVQAARRDLTIARVRGLLEAATAELATLTPREARQ